MNRLSTERRVAVVQALVEGNSIRATCRMTGVAKGTVLKLLADLGTADGHCNPTPSSHLVQRHHPARRTRQFRPPADTPDEPLAATTERVGAERVPAEHVHQPLSGHGHGFDADTIAASSMSRRLPWKYPTL